MDDKEINRVLEELIGRFLTRQNVNEIGNKEPKVLEEFIGRFLAHFDAYMVSAVQRVNAQTPQKTAPQEQKNILTAKEVAELLSMSQASIYGWVSAKKIPYIRVGSMCRFDRRDIEKWLESNKETRLR